MRFRVAGIRRTDPHRKLVVRFYQGQGPNLPTLRVQPKSAGARPTRDYIPRSRVRHSDLDFDL